MNRSRGTIIGEYIWLILLIIVIMLASIFFWQFKIDLFKIMVFAGLSTIVFISLIYRIILIKKERYNMNLIFIIDAEEMEFRDLNKNITLNKINYSQIKMAYWNVTKDDPNLAIIYMDEKDNSERLYIIEKTKIDNIDKLTNTLKKHNVFSDSYLPSNELKYFNDQDKIILIE